MEKEFTISSVQNYYGKVLKSKQDLQTTACCTAETMPEYLRDVLKKIHPEVQERFYGCGSPIPFGVSGLTVLDLGSGTGRDCYLFSSLVGSKGRVIGVDMTDEQIALAVDTIDYHTEKFGLNEPNVEFHKGYIEDLASLKIPDNSVDLVVSNCVINLSPEKKRVFSEIHRVLKPGGELYFSDVFADRRIPSNLQSDPVMVGECLGGAMYKEDFRRMMENLGFNDFRVYSKAQLAMENSALQEKVGNIKFSSITVRAFKLDLEDRCEEFGHRATYQGGIEYSQDEFVLDDHHVFKKDEPVAVCGNTAKMLSETRFKNYFKIEGDFSQHKGLFDCGPADESAPVGSCC